MALLRTLLFSPQEIHSFSSHPFSPWRLSFPPQPKFSQGTLAIWGSYHFGGDYADSRRSLPLVSFLPGLGLLRCVNVYQSSLFTPAWGRLFLRTSQIFALCLKFFLSPFRLVSLSPGSISFEVLPDFRTLFLVSSTLLCQLLSVLSLLFQSATLLG